MLIGFTFPHTIYTNYRMLKVSEITSDFQACLILNELKHWENVF